MKCRLTGRCLFLTICILQLISTGERQIFDFLGRMWMPILFNFFNLVFVIFGFFGAYQYKVKYVIVYLCWLFMWIGWNVFVICFYLNVGVLDRKSDWLNFGAGSASWFEENGIGCKPVYPTNLTEIDVLRPLRPDIVKGCLIDYQYVEVMHAAIQCLFAIPGVIAAIFLIQAFTARQENCKKKPPSIYYVEYSQPQQDQNESLELEEGQYTQHMTPRKVKRQSRHRASGRSQGRNTIGRTSQNRGTSGRSSQRSRRLQYQNPVTQLIDKANESSTSTESYRPNRPITTFGTRQGHSNPMYVHSRPGSTFSVNSGAETVERPPSVHSSYSNYHGVRQPTSLNPNGTVGRYPRTSTFVGFPKPVQNNIDQNGTYNTFTGSVYSDGSERPPPYMFGVNSETVI